MATDAVAACVAMAQTPLIRYECRSSDRINPAPLPSPASAGEGKRRALKLVECRINNVGAPSRCRTSDTSLRRETASPACHARIARQPDRRAQGVLAVRTDAFRA